MREREEQAKRPDTIKNNKYGYDMLLKKTKGADPPEGGFPLLPELIIRPLSNNYNNNNNNNNNQNRHSHSNARSTQQQSHHHHQQQQERPVRSDSTRAPTQLVHEERKRVQFKKDVSQIVCKRLSKYFKVGKIKSKDDFKNFSRKICHLILQKEKNMGLISDKKKKKISTFVDSFLKKKKIIK